LYICSPTKVGARKRWRVVGANEKWDELGELGLDNRKVGQISDIDSILG